ncbi:hypothetical protein B0H13DRAFT_1857288 [Mycena leptocephala]|nr:hypothetical protein B0H13DRAFT_1857288 [Mycena leptocephala]
MARPWQRNPPQVDESDPKSISRYKKWRSSYLYNYYNSAERNRKTRERMERLRAKQALDSPKVKQERLEAKRAAQQRYREKSGRIAVSPPLDRQDGNLLRSKQPLQRWSLRVLKPLTVILLRTTQRTPTIPMMARTEDLATRCVVIGLESYNNYAVFLHAIIPNGDPKVKLSVQCVEPSLSDSSISVVATSASETSADSADNQSLTGYSSSSVGIAASESIGTSSKTSADNADNESLHPTSDLQKGETGKNIDALLLQNASPVHVFVSYDIACRYSRHYIHPEAESSG